MQVKQLLGKLPEPNKSKIIIFKKYFRTVLTSYVTLKYEYFNYLNINLNYKQLSTNFKIHKINLGKQLSKNFNKDMKNHYKLYNLS